MNRLYSTSIVWKFLFSGLMVIAFFSGNAQISTAEASTSTLATFRSGLSNPHSFEFDGSSCYIFDLNTDKIYEYGSASLGFPGGYSTTPLDEFDAGVQATAPTCFRFNGDGSRFYILDSGTDKIYEYLMSTDYDISRGRYRNLGDFSVAAQTNSPQSFRFADNGTKMFVGSGNTIYQYNLPSSYYPGTATYAGSSKNFQPRDASGAIVTFLRGFEFNQSGYRFFALDRSSNKILEYELTVPYDLSTATFSDEYVNTSQSGMTDIYFKYPAYSQFMILGTSGDDIDVFTMNAYPTVSSLRVENGNENAENVEFRLDFRESVYGVTLDDFVINTTQNVQYDNLKLAYASDARYFLNFENTTGSGTIEVTLKDSGTDIFDKSGLPLSGGSFKVRAAVGTQYNLAAFKYRGDGQALPFESNSDFDAVTFNNDGTKVFLANHGLDSIRTYELSTPYDISTATKSGLAEGLSITNEERDVTDLTFDDTGLRLFIIGTSSDNVNVYTLSTPYDLKTAVFTNAVSVNAQTTAPYGFSFSHTGHKLFIIGNTDEILEYSLSTPFDITTLSYSGDAEAFDVAAYDSNTRTVVFDDDGDRMFISGTQNDMVYLFNLSTPYDVSTAVYAGDELALDVRDLANASTPYDIEFGANGSRLFIVDLNVDQLFEFGSNDWPRITSFDLVGNPEISRSGDEIFHKVKYEVIFDEPVSGVDAGDFYLSRPSLDIHPSRATDVTASEDGYYIEYKVNATSPGAINIVTQPSNDIVDSDGEGLSTTYTSETYFYGNQYNLQKAEYVDKLPLSTNDAQPVDFEFNADGSKLFILGISDDQIDQYSLSTPFDVTTATFDGDLEGLDVSAQSTSARDFLFDNTGSRLFLLSASTIFTYNLDSPYDISTATYAGAQKDRQVSSEESGAYAMAFNDTGTKLFVTGTRDDNIVQYSIPPASAYDVAVSVYSGEELEFDPGISNPMAMAFSADGTMMYLSGSNLGGDIYAYLLESKFQITTAVPLGKVYDVGGEEGQVYAIGFNGDGSGFYVVGASGDDINQYDLQSAQTSAASFELTDKNNGTIYSHHLIFDGPVTGVDASDFTLETSPGVTARISVGSYSNSLNQYRVSLSQIAGDGVLTLSLNESGTGIIDENGNDVNTSGVRPLLYTVGSAFDISYAEYLGSSEAFSVAGQEPTPYDMAFNNDGTKLFVMGLTGDDINEYTLSTPYDISTAAYSQVFDTGTDQNNPYSFAFSNDGKILNIYGHTDKNIRQFVLTTGFDVSTISVSSSSQQLDVSVQESVPQSIRFSDDGYQLFVLGYVSDKVSAYTLSSPFDVSSATYLGEAEAFSVSAQDSSPQSIAFSADGFKMVILGDSGDKLFLYDLSEPFDVSTAVHNEEAEYYFGSDFTSGKSVIFDNVGLKMFVLESSGDKIHEYDLNKAPEVTSVYQSSSNINASYPELLYFVTFSEIVSGFTVDDLELILNGVTGEISDFGQYNSNPLQYYAKVINVEGQGTVRLQVNAGNHIVDELGKSLQDNVISEAWNVDRLAPTALITLDDSSLKIGETTTVTITFSEEIVALDLTNITVEQGTLSSLQTTDNITYTSTFTPTEDVMEDALQLSVDMTQVQDLVGNIGEGSATSEDYLVDTQRPDLTITSDLNQLNASSTATITFAFTEVVTGFELTDITAQNGSMFNLASADGGMTYTATFTPEVQTESATNVITVDKSLVTDVIGNAGAGTSSSENFVIDTQAPSYTLSIDDQSLIFGETATITMSFTEPVFGLVDNETILINAPNGTVSDLILTEGAESLTVTFTPDAEIEMLENVVTFLGTGIVDDKNNPLVTDANITSENYAVDTKRPEVTIELDDQALLVGETAEVTFTFREPVLGFDNEAIILENGSLSDVASADNGLTFTATFTPDINVVDATNEILVSNTTYTDVLGNAGLGTTSSANFEINTKIPTVEIAISDDVLGVDESSVFTFTFSEEVTGFTTDDITVENGSLAGFTQTADPVVYEVTFTPNALVQDYENMLSVDNTGFNDLLGNAGVGTTESENFIIDGVIPTVEITVADETLTIGETNEVTITFSEPVLDFTNADFSNIGNGTLTDVVSEDGGITFTATFTPTDNLEEFGDLAINNSLYTDRAGNTGDDFTYKSFEIDTKAPTVQLQVSDDLLLIGEVTNVSIVFSESPVDFTVEDLKAQNGVFSDLRQEKGGDIYTVVFTPNAGTQDLTNEISIEAGSFTDQAGNPSLVGTSANFVIDVVAPTATVSIDNGDLLAGETAILTITFSEEVTGFDVSDLSIDAGEFSALETDDNITYATILTPPTVSEFSDLQITLDMPGVVDVQGNAGTSAILFGPINMDTNIPTATISTDVQALKVGETAVVTVVFSEEVVDFDDEDITITGGVLTDYYTEDGITFTATFNPDENLEIANGQVSVDMTGVFDLAGNAGSGTIATELIQIDTKRPTVALEMDDLKLLAGETAILTITFSEEVTGFELADVYPLNGVITDFNTVDNIVFTALFTPDEDVVQVNNKLGFSGEGFTDLAGNTALQGAAAYYEINTVIPTITFDQPEDKVYGDEAFVLTASSSSGEPIVFTSSDESVLSVSGNTVTIQSAGRATLTATQPATEDHSAAIPEEWEVEISKNTLTIYANAKEMVYGETLPELTMRFEGFVYDDNASDIDLPTISTSAVVESVVGVYPIYFTGGSSDNYEITTIGAELTITPADLLATANSYTKAYGEVMPELDITYEGFVNGDNESRITEPEISTEATMNSGVGDYDILLSGGASENYNISLANGLITVTKAALSITADDKQRAYGEPNPELTMTYEGFVLDETTSDLLTLPQVSTVATQASVPGDYTIDVAGATSDNYAITETAGTLTIIKADQTITFEEIADIDLLNTDEVNLVASANTGLDITFELVAGDGTINGTILTVNATGTYEVKAIQVGNGNYNEASVTRFFNVNDSRKSDQTITFEALTDKTYGDAPFTLTATANSGLAVSYSVDGPAAINGSVLTITGAGMVTVTATQSGDDDFNPAPSVAQSFTVEKTTLMAIADDATMTYGEEVPTLTVSYSGFVNGDTEADLGEISTATTAASSASDAGDYDITVAGGSDENYDFTYQSGTLTIEKANQSITFDELLDKTYGDDPFALISTASSGLDVSYAVDGPASLNGSEVTINGVGEVTVTATQSGNSNFNAAAEVTQSFTVSKATLLATADDATSTYGHDIPALTVSYSGFVNGDNEANLDELAVAATDATSSSDAGTYDITVSGGSDDNYELTYQNGTLTIGKADQTITFDALEDKTYGDGSFTMSASANSGLNVSYSVEGPAALDGDEVVITGAGEVTISANQSGDNNFNPAADVMQSFTVAKANLVTTADDASTIYGEVIPDLTVSYTGFVNGEDDSVLNEMATASTTASAESVAGTYEITVAGGDATNYAFTYETGTLTINKADQTIDFAAIAEVDLASANSVDLMATASSGLEVTFTLIAGDGSISGTTLTVNNTGTYTVEATQVGNDNYEAATAVTQSFTVTDSRKADQTITFETLADKTYGDASFSLTATASSGLDIAYAVSGPASIEANEVTITGAGEVTITASQSGDDDFNPAADLTQSFNVAKANLVARADDESTIYGEELPVLTVSYTGFVNGEDESVLNEMATASTSASAESDAGTYEITVTGGDAANYAFTYETGTLTINKADQTIDFAAIADVDLASANSVDLTATASSGLDVVFTLITGDGSISGNTVTVNSTGTYTVEATQVGNDNYEAASAMTQSFTVTDSRKSDQTISFELPAEVYVTDGPLSLSATSDAGIAITYEIVSGSDFASVNGSELTLIAAGMVEVRAFNDGNDDFNPASATATLEILPVFTLSGQVTDENGDVFTSGVATVRASGETTGSQVALGEDGIYSFADLKQGTYYVTITPNDPTAYLGTAFGNVNTFQNATPIMLFSDSTGFDIQMIAKPDENLLDGDGVVTGRVIESDDENSRITTGRILEGAPIANVSVLLVRKADGQLMTEVFTDENGYFSISGIPFGDFTVVINMPGIEGGISSDINVVEGQELLMTAMVGKEGIVFETSKSILGTNYTDLKIYPNPTVNAFVLDGAKKLKVIVYDQYGRALITTGSNQVTDVSDLSDGLYLLKVFEENGRLVRTEKLIKKSR